jgi:hypothetical protein
MQPEGAVFDAAEAPSPDAEMSELARLADSLVEQVAETRRHYEQLRADLDSFESTGTVPVHAETAPAESATAPVRREERQESPDESRERLRLFALNLALSGETRETVSAQLHDKFGVDDVDDILGAVFPDESGNQHKRRFRRRSRGG